jgi:hypothetical protein
MRKPSLVPTLEAARGGLEPQIDRQHRLEGRRQLPVQARFEQHPDGIAETADHERIARRRQHRAGGEQGGRGDAEGDAETGGGLNSIYGDVGARCGGPT